MEAALDRIQFKYSLTDRQRKLLQFSFIGIIYDSTKFLMLFIFFACIEQVPAYIFCSLLLILLRSNQGGLHLKHYTSCFVLSFFYLFSAIAIFPDIFTDIPQSVGLIILFICMLINYSAGPQKNKKIYSYLKDPSAVKKSKLNSFIICILYMLTYFIFSDIPLFQQGFWIIVLHTIQIVFVILRTKRKEKKNG